MDQVNVRKDYVTICKVDESKQIVKGIVYKPLEKDAHGDWMTPEDIEKSAYSFMKNLRLSNVDTNHSCEAVDAYVCESYIAKAADPDGYPEGSWIVAVKVDDSDVWQGVLDKEYTGFSMYGKGYAIKDTEPPAETSEVQ